jgi:hypothetical protein
MFFCFVSPIYRCRAILFTTSGVGGSPKLYSSCFGKHLVCGSIVMVLVFDPSGISKLVISFQYGSFPLPHCCHCSGIRMEFATVSFWL